MKYSFLLIAFSLAFAFFVSLTIVFLGVTSVESFINIIFDIFLCAMLIPFAVMLYSAFSLAKNKGALYMLFSFVVLSLAKFAEIILETANSQYAAYWAVVDWITLLSIIFLVVSLGGVGKWKAR